MHCAIKANPPDFESTEPSERIHRSKPAHPHGVVKVEIKIPRVSVFSDSPEPLVSVESPTEVTSPTRCARRQDLDLPGVSDCYSAT